MRKIGGILGRSPFGPLFEHMVKALQSVRELPELIDALFNKDYDKVKCTFESIRNLEREADAIKSEIRDNLSSSMFSSVERAETLHLSSSIDAIADNAFVVAKYAVVRETTLPEAIAKMLTKMANSAIDSGELLLETMRQLREIMDTSGQRADAELVLNQVNSLAALNEHIEDAEVEVLSEVFKSEDEISPNGSMILAKITRTLADTAHNAENVNDGIRRIVLNR